MLGQIAVFSSERKRDLIFVILRQIPKTAIATQRLPVKMAA